MRFKSVQWNIGGGYMRGSNDDPGDPLSYDRLSLNEIISLLEKMQPDIITLQEAHSSSEEIQAETIAKALGLQYVLNDVYDASHIQEGQGLSQSIISRFPLRDHKFTLFLNPRIEGRGPKGEHWTSHDKGLTSCVADLGDGTLLDLKTSHSFPYRRFGVEPLGPAMKTLREDMAAKMAPVGERYLYQGDINFDNASAQPLLPALFQDGIQEVLLSDPTTPKGRKYDHVIYRGLKLISSKVISGVLTDHFPVVSEFEC